MTFTKDHRHGWLTCPACGYRMDGSTELDGHKAPPKDGDWSVCIACATVNIYANNATVLRPPTVEERDEYVRAPSVQAAVQAVIEVRDRAESWPKGPRR